MEAWEGREASEAWEVAPRAAWEAQAWVAHRAGRLVVAMACASVTVVDGSRAVRRLASSRFASTRRAGRGLAVGGEHAEAAAAPYDAHGSLASADTMLECWTRFHVA